MRSRLTILLQLFVATAFAGPCEDALIQLSENLGLQVRSARNSDRSEILGFIDRSRRRLGLSLEDKGYETDDLIDIERGYGAGRGSFLVLINDKGKIVGTAGIERLADGRGIIRKLYLADRYRGTGLGQKTLSTLVETGRELQLSSLILDTRSEMQTAMRLYERNGFQSRGAVSKEGKIRYELNLSSPE